MSAFGPSGMFGASNTNTDGASAFGANTGAFNAHSHSNAGFNNNNAGGGFGAGGFNNNAPSNNHPSTFDASGNTNPRGRGRGTGIRGGRGGGSRGSANMTYVAPGLSSSQSQNLQQLNQPAFTAGSSGDLNSGYSAPGANRGRGGTAGYARGVLDQALRHPRNNPGRNPRRNPRRNLRRNLYTPWPLGKTKALRTAALLDSVPCQLGTDLKRFPECSQSIMVVQ
ncbi:hypothetical protein BGZ67_006869 [Mortierella alpina]|nr:hypothetical protein BGZ67_006869 [Mortierella alpina]